MTKQNMIDTILSHYNSELKNRRIISTKVSEYIANAKDFNTCKKDIEKRLEIKLRNNGVCSKVMVNQLARHNCQLGEVFTNKNSQENFQFIEYYNSTEILDVIELVETGRKNGEMFRKPPLKGLYKIHHNSHIGNGYSLLLNIKNYWFNSKDELIPKREKEFDQLVEKTDSMRMPVLLNEMHTKAVYSKELTGEWIIYAKHDNVNYFLCLALHNEGDENILKNRIELCLNEFPEIRSTK